MEAAFANSQELVLFVTELNTGAYSVHFLQDYECERYYQYNRNLLFSREEQEIEALLNKEGKNHNDVFDKADAADSSANRCRPLHCFGRNQGRRKRCMRICRI